MATQKKATTNKAQIGELVNKLGAANSKGEKKRIRRDLRAMGHKGGLIKS